MLGMLNYAPNSLKICSLQYQKTQMKKKRRYNRLLTYAGLLLSDHCLSQWVGMYFLGGCSVKVVYKHFSLSEQYTRLHSNNLHHLN